MVDMLISNLNDLYEKRTSEYRTFFRNWLKEVFETAHKYEPYQYRECGRMYTLYKKLDSRLDPYEYEDFESFLDERTGDRDSGVYSILLSKIANDHYETLLDDALGLTLPNSTSDELSELYDEFAEDEEKRDTGYTIEGNIRGIAREIFKQMIANREF